MVIGYTAFLDVLGFSSLVSSDHGERIEGYLQCLKDVFDVEGVGAPVDYVVFSDSIILATKRCRYETPYSDELLNEFIGRLPWAAFVQPCHIIPFHPLHPLDTNYYDGFAIVPSNGDSNPAALRDSLNASLKHLTWLKSLAPNPQAQNKYKHSLSWLSHIIQQWSQVASRLEQIAEQKRVSP